MLNDDHQLDGDAMCIYICEVVYGEYEWDIFIAHLTHQPRSDLNILSNCLQPKGGVFFKNGLCRVFNSPPLPNLRDCHFFSFLFVEIMYCMFNTISRVDVGPQEGEVVNWALY